MFITLKMTYDLNTQRWVDNYELDCQPKSEVTVIFELKKMHFFPVFFPRCTVKD